MTRTVGRCLPEGKAKRDNEQDQGQMDKAGEGISAAAPGCSPASRLAPLPSELPARRQGRVPGLYLLALRDPEEGIRRDGRVLEGEALRERRQGRGRLLIL